MQLINPNGKYELNTRTGGGSENHTDWRGGAEVRGLSRAILEHFLAKILGPWVNPFKVKKGRISKKLPF